MPDSVSRPIDRQSTAPFTFLHARGTDPGGAGQGAQAVPLRSVPRARTLACVAGTGRRARTAAYAWGARPGFSVLRRRVERPRLRRAPQTRPRSLRLGVSGLHMSRPGSVLVGAVSGAVDAVPFVVRPHTERFEQPIPPALFRPAVKSVEHALPRPELRRKVAPWDTRSSPPQHRLYEPTLVVARPTDASLAIEDLVNLLPLPIG